MVSHLEFENFIEFNQAKRKLFKIQIIHITF